MLNFDQGQGKREFKPQEYLLVFREFEFESDAKIGQKGAFFKGLRILFQEGNIMQKAYRNFTYATLFVLLTACAVLNSGTAGAIEQGDPFVNGKYSKYIFQDVKPLDIPPEELAKIKQEQ